MKIVPAIIVNILLGSFAMASLAHAQTPTGREVLTSTTYVSLDPASRGSSFQLAVVLKIRRGFHINARQKSADYLIATDLRAEALSGFEPGPVSYPQGELHTFTFSKKPLNVYQDTVTLRMSLTTTASAPLGQQKIPLKLRYQACSTELCLPPVTLNFDAAVNVAATASEEKRTHPEIFRTQ
ncbi:MAG TPA: protein-disulfide reductase DsbD domain-containing protein [Candidatus Dormibacteraeota bacterium]|nr:protein-disulfide reductase DsbD domain-containing protein [Candidatus Dormibacteraeota bacterium]